MPWFTPESWRQLQAVADDKLCGSYQAFVRKTNRAIREFEAQGIEVEKFSIDVEHMAAWCRRHGYRVDSRSRALYGVLLASHDGELFDLEATIDVPPRPQ